MRTGCCGGRRFWLSSAHCPQQPRAATHARKTRVFCSLSALRRIAGKPASNRTRSGCCDEVCNPHCSQRLSASFHAKITARPSPLEWVPGGEGVNNNQEPLNRAELFYRRQQIATRGYEACRLTAGHNNHRRPNHRNFSSPVSCRQLQITTIPPLHSGNEAFYPLLPILLYHRYRKPQAARTATITKPTLYTNTYDY
jgi:hypothetical protein